MAELAKTGWRVAVVRECSIRGVFRSSMVDVCEDLAVWIRAGDSGLVAEWAGGFAASSIRL